MDLWTSLLDDGGGDDKPKPVPGLPTSRQYSGPWFSVQLQLSVALGLSSFLLFCFLRTRYTLLYAPRTKLKGFSPSEAHAYDSSHRFFGWIMPTLRTSEFTVLQVVGLDAAVLLNFFKMSFFFFSTCSFLAAVVLVPFNLSVYGSVDSHPDEDDNSTSLTTSISSHLFVKPVVKIPTILLPGNRNATLPSDGNVLLGLLDTANASLTLQLLFTYLFSLLALYFAYGNFKRFIRNRQMFSLELVHSISGRTVLVSNLPGHLRGDRSLATYFESLSWPVESVSVVRSIASLSPLLAKRTQALLNLEAAWVTFVGNPSSIPEYLPPTPPIASHNNHTGLPVPTSNSTSSPLSPNPTSTSPAETGGKKERLEIEGRKRPRIREGGNGWCFWRKWVDEIEWWEGVFERCDEAVRRKRRAGRFEATGAAFVTFESMAHAQIATQVTHSPTPDQIVTVQAPEPRDIVWPNVGKSESNRWIRDILITSSTAILLIFWLTPVVLLATLLSYEELKRIAPWLAKLIDMSPHLQAFVQNTLPSTAIIAVNAVLPFLLEGLSYGQGFQARSWIEYSLLKKYFLFLLISVIFVWNATSSYWDLLRDYSDSPLKIPEKIAMSLRAGNAKHFFLSYTMLQAIGMMPFQLLNVGTVVSLAFSRMFYTRTPRDFAELNAPPMLNYGTVYPQAILIFCITIIYSVISPLILVFGALYFGIGYLVYKQKLLFVYYKPYESAGQAWPITFSRLLLGVVIFQLFMVGLFTLDGAWKTSAATLPLVGITIFWSWNVFKTFEPLCDNVSLTLIAEVQRGEGAESVMRGAGEPEGDSGVTRSQTNLNRRRYAVNQEDLYLAPADERTDYSQPPMGGYYPGVLNTGRRRYAHPALAGVLPTPWLPLRSSESLLSQTTTPNATSTTNKNKKEVSVALSLRRKVSRLRRKVTGSPAALSRPDLVQEPTNGSGERLGASGSGGGGAGFFDGEGAETNPWDDHSPGAGVGARGGGGRPDRAKLHKRLSFDPATGVIMLDDDQSSEEDPEEEDAPLEGGGDEEASEATPLIAERRFTPYFPHPERRRTLSRPTAPPPGLPPPASS